ncbi:DUF4381 domain-containing protein [Shewanella donghaensis]|uniref:DUF4381 domain-containing protein n=1 Tax=Shewanella donghaensis TaxID=238836 RepID=UPI0011821FA4|nr:DUF4381 domain-containing protein [Shewanella donghaensis]
MQHSPPSTYILRDLVDVNTVEPVSWWPGFELLPTGWWYVLVFGVLILMTLLIIRLHYVWKNRYRNEAINAIRQQIYQTNSKNGTESEPPQYLQHNTQQIFFILKQVLIYIEPQSAKLADTSVLINLDKLINHRSKHDTEQWQGELGQRWIASLYNPHVRLSDDELILLTRKAIFWLKYHRNHFSAQPQLFSAIRSLVRGQ